MVSSDMIFMNPVDDTANQGVRLEALEHFASLDRRWIVKLAQTRDQPAKADQHANDQSDDGKARIAEEKRGER